jgi:hypothetical protein
LISSTSSTFANTGPAAELEGQVARVVDGHARDVAGQQVRRALDAAEVRLERAGQGAREHRLADARHVLEQDMPARQERGHDRLHCGPLAEEDALDVLDEREEDGRHDAAILTISPPNARIRTRRAGP